MFAGDGFIFGKLSDRLRFHDMMITLVLSFLLVIPGTLGVRCSYSRYSSISGTYINTYYECSYSCCGYGYSETCCYDSDYNNYGSYSSSYSSSGVTIGIIVGSVIGGLVGLAILISICFAIGIACSKKKTPVRRLNVQPQVYHIASGGGYVPGPGTTALTPGPQPVYPPPYGAPSGYPGPGPIQNSYPVFVPAYPPGGVNNGPGTSTAPQPPASAPASKGQPPASNGQPPAANGQPPASNGQPPASNGQPPAANGQPPTANGQPPATTG